MIKFQNLTGIPHDTKMLNSATGEDISGILAVEYGISIVIGRDGVKASCRLAMVGADVTALNTTFETLNPISRRYEAVRTIEFRDGTRVEISDDGTPSVIAPQSTEDAA